MIKVDVHGHYYDIPFTKTFYFDLLNQSRKLTGTNEKEFHEKYGRYKVYHED